MRVTIVEDNEAVAKGIAYRLQDRGHAVTVFHDGSLAERYLRDADSDVVILDINLPGMDGLSLLRAVRARGDARPVLLLTARADTGQKVAGLDAGADDYLAKPFDMDELEARVRALARRSHQPLQRRITLGPLALDADGRRATLHGEPLDLPRRELALLAELLRSTDRIVSKHELLARLYGDDEEVRQSVIEVHASRLRKKLAPAGLALRMHRGMGYALRLVDPGTTGGR